MESDRKELQLGIGIGFVILTLLALVLIASKVAIDKSNNFNWGWIIISVELLYSIISLKILEPGNQAVVVVLGKPTDTVESGFHFIPAGICWLITVPNTILQIQIPGEPETIYKGGDDSLALPAGMVRPIRATTASADIAILNFPGQKEAIEKDVLNKPMTLEVTGYMRVRIHNVVDFVNSFKDVEELKKQLRDTFEAVMKEEYGVRTAGLINSHLKEISAAITRKLKKIVERSDWGLEMEECKIIENDLTKTLNTALRNAELAAVDLSKADAEAETVKKKATAERFKTEQEGLAVANNARELNKAQAEHYKEIGKTAANREVLKIFQITKALEKAKFSLIPEGGNIFGVASGIKELLAGQDLNKTQK